MFLLFPTFREVVASPTLDTTVEIEIAFLQQWAAGVCFMREYKKGEKRSSEFSLLGEEARAINKTSSP